MLLLPAGGGGDDGAGGGVDFATTGGGDLDFALNVAPTEDGDVAGLPAGDLVAPSFFLALDTVGRK